MPPAVLSGNTRRAWMPAPCSALQPEARPYSRSILGSLRHSCARYHDLQPQPRRILASWHSAFSMISNSLLPKRNLNFSFRVWCISHRPRMCDPALMKIVLANLLSNAVKFTRLRAAATIEIGQTMVESFPVLFVRDNGAGFDMRYAICKQTLRSIPALAPARKVRGNRRRAGHRAAHFAEGRRRNLGGGRTG